MQDRITYDNIIDKVELKRIQDSVCKATGVCACCVDAKGEELTSWSGKNKEVLQVYLTNPLRDAVLSRVEEGSLEDMAVEEAADGVQVAAVAILIQGKTLLNWIVIGVSDARDTGAEKLKDCRRFSEREFYQVLDLLREGGTAIFSTKRSRMDAEMESMRNRYSAEEMKNSLDRIEAMAEVVQLLDSDDAIEAIMLKMLTIVGEHLQLTSAGICQQNPDDSTVDIVAGWHAKGIVPPFDKHRGIEAPAVMFSDKPVIVSSDTIRSDDKVKDWLGYQVRAFILFPLMKSARGGMIVCFNQSKSDHIWTMEEIKFISDAVKILQSILTRRIQKNSLAGSYASLVAILEHMGCGIYVKEIETGNILFINKMLKRTFATELRSGTFESLIEKEIPSLSKSGSTEIHDIAGERWYDLLYTEITWVDENRAALYSLYDITDKKLYQEKIEQQAYTDFLTGLYNRMCCERDLAWYVDDAKKRQVQGGILYIDLDDFKHINDGLGHQYGDILLKEISNAFSRIEGIKTTCYRVGGDEFLILIPPECFGETKRILADIQYVFSQPWDLKNSDYYCTMSMGVVTFPDDGDRVQELIKKADIAMYEAKKSGKNRVAWYSEGIASYSGRRLDMEKNMRAATVAGYKEFEIYYQPIIDISLPGTPCTGAEALIRWNSKSMGFVSPTEFIPLAEYLGLINPIGNYVLLEACKECKRWNDNGYPRYKVNVNLSVAQLLQNDIVEVVRQALSETGLEPRNLTLEVTESLAINDMERVKEILVSIKELGVRIALDDFGTGYSCLNHIREFPFDVIKVDQSFVKDLAEDTYSQSFIKLVAELADSIGVSICVEGIETEEQYRVLEDMRVRMVQGYYFDKPMPQAEFAKKYV